MTPGRSGPPRSPLAAPSSAPAPTGERCGLRLNCRGVVQGVGFRPAVARLAARLALQGRLINIPGGVCLELAGPRPALERFLAQLVDSLPAAARMEPPQLEWLSPPLPQALATGAGLQIGASQPQPLGIGLVAASLVADRAPCRDCRRELRDPADRRCAYPFISCCSCGPRYSIARAEPFSRAHTSLAGFALCPACQAEFDDPGDRRFHAETIGCPACGPQLRLLDASGAVLAGPDAPQRQDANGRRTPMGSDPLQQAVALLRRGRILALQGVGGFQLLVAAGDGAAVARLRTRKRRPDKPFALLVASPEQLADLVQPDPQELAALHDPAAPIVLLPVTGDRHESALAGVAPGAAQLGVMLPASPLHLLLAEAFAAPLVATSGNRSGEPLCIDPAEAMVRLAGIADAFLVHDRAIARPLDDSLLQLIDGRPALLRRARGYAPEAVPLPRSLALPPPATAAEAPADPQPLLALGSDLRSAPALARGDRLWLAPHLGDLADGRCLERWRCGIDELLSRHVAGCQGVALDAHPNYVSSQQARAWLGAPAEAPAGEPDPLGSGQAGPDANLHANLCLQLPSAGRSRQPDPATATPAPQLLAVAHHRAHGLAVAAEHGLILPLPALVLDGLGYGGGTAPLWGGELLWLEPAGARRLASLRPFPLPGGERAVREPRRSALGLLWAADLLEHPGAAALQRAFGDADLPLLEQAMASGCNSPWCSSAGRLFDAVAALLDLVQIASHDAHAGLLLQAAAGRAPADAGAYPLPLARRDRLTGRQPPAARAPEDGEDPDAALPRLDWQPLLQALLDDIAAGRDAGLCAARFHAGLVQGLAALLPWPWPEAREQGAQPDTAPSQGKALEGAVILAGGCFQNRLLLEGLIAALRRRGLQPFWGEQIPLNDGGLAAGQLLALGQAQQASVARHEA